MTATPVEAILVDAYSSYILKQAQTQASDLRRETAEYAMSRAARRSRLSLWTRTIGRAATAARRQAGVRGSAPTMLPAE